MQQSSSDRLDLRALAVARGGRVLVEGLDVALEPGGLLLVQGQNGSGKSSLLRVLAGLARPAEGQVAWAGRDIRRDMPAHRARLHLLAAGDALKGPLTVRENLAFAAGLLGGLSGSADSASSFALDGLEERPVRFLSSGQRRRVALSRLLLAPRPLWLLDEPEAGLDRESKERLVRRIEEHRAAGGIAVVATHDRLALRPTLSLELQEG